jgi:hypothetical protein
MSDMDFETADSLAEDLAGFCNRPQEEIRSRLTEHNWRRIALIYRRLLNLIEEGAKYFGRMQEIRRNPEWAPNRPIRAELKLEKVNKKVDRAERELFEAVGISPPAGAQNSQHPLAPRSLVYFLPLLEAEADLLEAKAHRDGVQ